MKIFIMDDTCCMSRTCKVCGFIDSPLSLLHKSRCCVDCVACCSLTVDVDLLRSPVPGGLPDVSDE